MNVVLAGTRSFGVAVLDMLRDRGEWVDSVVAPPGDKLALRARDTGVPVYDSFGPSALIGIDLIVAAHSHAFIGSRTRNRTKLGAIGFHPSLLPRHRGRDAVRWTIKMGDPVAGGSVYWLNDNVDCGPIAAQRHLLVNPAWTHHDLWARLFPLGVELISEVLDDLKAGVVRQVPQDEKVATWEPSWDRPPLYRPELPEIGAMPAGFRLEVK